LTEIPLPQQQLLTALLDNRQRCAAIDSLMFNVSQIKQEDSFSRSKCELGGVLALGWGAKNHITIFQAKFPNDFFRPKFPEKNS